MRGRWMLVMFAAALMAPTGPDVASKRGFTRDPCPQRIDYSQPDYIQRPEESCCSTTANCASTPSPANTYKRWLRQDVAAKGPDAIVEIGAVETTSIDTSTVIPPNTSSCFGLSVSGNELSGANLALYVDDVTTRATALGQQPPKFFKQIRPENITREHMVALDGSISGALKHWMLRTDRSWSTVTTFLSGGGTSGGCPDGGSCCATFCRVPTNGYGYWGPDCATTYPPGTDGGCDDSASEGQYSFQTLLQNKENNLWQNAVYSMFFRGGTPQASYYPVAVLADMSHPDYRAWRIAYERENMAREGTSGISVTPKDHFYWDFIPNPSGGWGRQYHWIDMGDGTGGHKISGTSTVDTLTEAVQTTGFDDGYSGKPEIRGTGSRCADTATGCDYAWPEYAYGMAKFFEEAKAAGLPTMMRAKAIHYEGCLTSWSPSAANEYDDGLTDVTGCKDYYDDPTTAEGSCTAAYDPYVCCTGSGTGYLNCNEAAMWRSVYQNAERLTVDIQGGEPDDAVTDAPPGSVAGGIGVNTGIGVTYAQLKAMIDGGSPHPSWMRVVDSNDGYRVPDKLCVDTRETNPETAITP